MLKRSGAGRLGKALDSAFLQALFRRFAIEIGGDKLKCSQCFFLKREKKLDPQCHSKPCRNAEFMNPRLDAWLSFVDLLNSAEFSGVGMAGKILDFAEIKDPRVVEFLVKALAKYKALLIERSRQK